MKTMNKSGVSKVLVYNDTFKDFEYFFKLKNVSGNRWSSTKLGIGAPTEAMEATKEEYLKMNINFLLECGYYVILKLRLKANYQLVRSWHWMSISSWSTYKIHYLIHWPR